MTAADLRKWQRSMSWTQATAAQKLGVSLATYKRYLTDGPPRLVGLACAALAAGLGSGII